MSKEYERYIITTSLCASLSREGVGDSFPVKRKATDPLPEDENEDYRIFHGDPSLAGIWDRFVVLKWHAGPVKTYPIQHSPRTILRGNEILFYPCVNSNEPKMKYIMENLEGLSNVAREVLMLPDDLPDEDELMWRRIPVL